MKRFHFILLSSFLKVAVSQKLENNKKVKLSNDTTEEDSEVPQSNNHPAEKCERVMFTSGITPLKMPGHTGYLTFATVPPGLKRISLPIEDNFSESAESAFKEDSPSENISESASIPEDSTVQEL